MNKKISVFLSAVAVAMLFTGCSMCTAPIVNDPSCVEDTHFSAKGINPDALAFGKPNFGTSKELFRPVFKAGNKRVSAIGSGTSLEDATNDAVGKILRENKCDYLVAVTRIISTKTHPTWRFFATTNYSVEIAGLPIFLDKLSVEEFKEVGNGNGNGGSITINCNCKCSKVLPPPQPKNPLALLNLSDIDVKISAKGQTNDKVGVAFPVCPKAGCPKAAK